CSAMRAQVAVPDGDCEFSFSNRRGIFFCVDSLDFKQPRELSLSGRRQLRGLFAAHAAFIRFPLFFMPTQKETQAAPVTVEEPTSKKPIKTFVADDVTASVIARTYVVRGTERTFYSVSFSRSYRDGSGWKYVKTFDLDDLRRVIAVAQQADQYIRSVLDDSEK